MSVESRKGAVFRSDAAVGEKRVARMHGRNSTGNSISGGAK